MRIGVVTWQFPVVSETFILDHVAGLVERGRSVGVFSWAATAPANAPSELQSTDVLASTRRWLPRGRWAKRIAGVAALAQLPAAPLWRAGNLGLMRHPRDTLLLGHRLRQFLAGEGVVHAHFGVIGERLALLRRAGILRKPLVVSLHGFDATRDEATLREGYRHLFRGADRIVVTTRFMAEQAAGLGCPSAKLVRSPIGIRLDRFTFHARAWSAREPLRLLSTARLVEKKGIEYAVRAVAVLAARGVSLQYRIVGDGPLRESLQRLAQDLGAAGAITFVGAQPREAVIRELAGCHVFLFPSVKAADGDQEGQGMALVEAQASGAPCVATRSGGIPEVLEDGSNGYLVPERDPAAIADAIERLAQRHSEWPEMGRLGRQRVERDFGLDRHLDDLERLYRDLLSQPLSPAP